MLLRDLVKRFDASAKTRRVADEGDRRLRRWLADTRLDGQPLKQSLVAGTMTYPSCAVAESVVSHRLPRALRPILGPAGARRESPRAEAKRWRVQPASELRAWPPFFAGQDVAHEQPIVARLQAVRDRQPAGDSSFTSGGP